MESKIIYAISSKSFFSQSDLWMDNIAVYRGSALPKKRCIHKIKNIIDEISNKHFNNIKNLPRLVLRII